MIVLTTADIPYTIFAAIQQIAWVDAQAGGDEAIITDLVGNVQWRSTAEYVHWVERDNKKRNFINGAIVSRMDSGRLFLDDGPERAPARWDAVIASGTAPPSNCCGPALLVEPDDGRYT